MKNQLLDKIAAFRATANSPEEFMKKLATLDEQGQLTPALQRMVNGGVEASTSNVISKALRPPVLGIWLPTTATS